MANYVAAGLPASGMHEAFICRDCSASRDCYGAVIIWRSLRMDRHRLHHSRIPPAHVGQSPCTCWSVHLPCEELAKMPALYWVQRATPRTRESACVYRARWDNVSVAPALAPGPSTLAVPGLP